MFKLLKRPVIHRRLIRLFSESKLSEAQYIKLWNNCNSKILDLLASKQVVDDIESGAEVIKAICDAHHTFVINSHLASLQIW